MLTPYFSPAFPSGGTFCAPATPSAIPSGLAAALRSKKALTFVDVAFDHDAHDGGVAGGDLCGQRAGHFRLVEVILERVAVAAVDH